MVHMGIDAGQGIDVGQRENARERHYTTSKYKDLSIASVNSNVYSMDMEDRRRGGRIQHHTIVANTQCRLHATFRSALL